MLTYDSAPIEGLDKPKAPDEELSLKVVNHVFSKLEDYDRRTSKLRAKFLRYYKLYATFKNDPKKTYKWKSNLFIPKVFEVIETIMPRMIANRPRYIPLPWNEEEDSPIVKLYSDFSDHQWQRADANLLMEEVLKAGLMYGTGVMRADWQVEEEVEKSVVKKEVSDEEEEVTETTTAKVRDQGWVGTYVDIFDFYMDPIKGLKGDAVIHRMRDVEFSKIEKRTDLFFNLDKLKEKLSDLRLSDADQTSAQITNYETDKENLRYSTGVSDSVDKNDVLKCTLLDYWGLWYDDRTHEVLEYCITVEENTKTLLRFQANPYIKKMRPFFIYQDYIVPGEAYGVGECEILEHLQLQYNTTRNQRLDNVHLVLNKQFEVVKNQGITADEIKRNYGPGGVLLVDQLNTVREIGTQDVTASSYNEENASLRDIQTVSGVSDYAKGTESLQMQQKTATGMSILADAANQRFNIKLRHLEYMLQNLGIFILNLNKQFVTDDYPFVVYRGDKVQLRVIGVKELSTDFDVIVEAGSTMPKDPATKWQKFQSLVQIAGLSPELVDMKEIIVEGLKSLDIDNYQRFFKAEINQLEEARQEEMTQMRNQPVGEVPMDQVPPELLAQIQG